MFQPIDERIIENEIYSLKESKATPEDSLPRKVIKENCDIFSARIVIDFKTSIDLGTFPNNSKHADISPVFKKGEYFINLTTDQLAFYQLFRKFLSDYYFIK